MRDKSVIRVSEYENVTHKFELIHLFLNSIHLLIQSVDSVLIFVFVFHSYHLVHLFIRKIFFDNFSLRCNSWHKQIINQILSLKRQCSEMDLIFDLI